MSVIYGLRKIRYAPMTGVRQGRTGGKPGTHTISNEEAV
jgi:hypothetical protein